MTTRPQGITFPQLVRNAIVGWLTRGSDVKLYETNISVMDFGAKGDGVTDDTVAIQNAINYIQGSYVAGTSNSAAMGACRLFFPSGYYKVTAPLNITKKIAIEGEGYSEFSTGARIFQTTSNDLFFVQPSGGGASVSFTNLTLFNTVSGSGHLINTQPNGTTFMNSNRISRCCFQNPQQMALRICGDDWQIDNNSFDVSGFSGNCIQLGSAAVSDVASNVLIANNDFFNIVSHCILHYNAYGVVVTGNRMSQPNTSTYSVAFYDAADAAATLMKWVNITGNYIQGARRILGVYGGNQINFSDNVCVNCGNGAGEVYIPIVVLNATTDLTVNNNIIQGSYGAKPYFSDAGAVSITNLSLIGNTFDATSPTSPALIVSSSLNSARIGPNTFNGFASQTVSVSEKRTTTGTFFNPGAITTGASVSITIACNSAQLGDRVELTPILGAWPAPVGIELRAFISSAGTITFMYRNGTAGTLTPSAHDLTYVVTR